MVHVTETTCTTNGQPDPDRFAAMEALREEWLEVLAEREKRYEALRQATELVRAGR